MVNTSDKKNKAIAIVGTLLVHTIIVLILFFIAFKTPIPPFPESPAPGIELDFGNLTEGTGNVEDDKMGTTESVENTTTETKQSNPTDNTESIVTNEVEESVNIKTTKKPKKPIVKTTERVVEKPVEEEKPSSELAELLKKFKNKKSGSTGGGDGNSGKSGNAGDPNGNPDGNGKGGSGGTGNGTNFNLRGRTLLQKPEISDDSQEEGKVVVEITVDENGKVINAVPGARGSTTTSPILYSKARQGALSAKYNPSPEGVKIQKATVTVVFSLD